jgi:hypothetical protein
MSAWFKLRKGNFSEAIFVILIDSYIKVTTISLNIDLIDFKHKCRVINGKPPVSQLFKNFLTFYEREFSRGPFTGPYPSIHF